MSSDLQGAVGRSVLRREDDYLLRGQGRFVDDLPTPLNTLHLAFVLSPYAHARIASIDASEALALDGVVDVFTGADLAAMVKPIAAQIELPGYSPNARDVLAIDEVRFAGEAVAVVVAESQYLAEDGLELVDVDYEPLPAVVDIHEATEPAAPQVNPTVPGNVYFEGRFATDGVAAAFDAAALVISEDFHSNRVTAVPIEARG
ncbi:MAG: xanthine dehydrogenase family protein molybdopterin-binding subunit, partial [Acidimicrobiales bacterium]|nr:xanthine dehydrogenase family protein molybdopterin-binding subunit [Acidimicrobiales bacterium]